MFTDNKQSIDKRHSELVIDERIKLYWKTDSDIIKELISTLPTKYLIGRINKCRRELGDIRKIYERIVVVNWKGYTFTVSQKTLEEELLNGNRENEFYMQWTVVPRTGHGCWSYHYWPYEKRKKEKQVKRR